MLLLDIKASTPTQSTAYRVVAAEAVLAKDRDASVEFRVVMTPDDLQKAGLDEVGKKWA